MLSYVHKGCDNMNKIPYRYDIVGSFLRSERLKHARENFNNNLISKNELKKLKMKRF